MGDNSQNNKRIAKNTLMLYIRMFLIMLVTLYTSRVILKALGVEDFGLYNIVGGVVVLFTFVVAVCLCFGMNGFSDPDFFSIWYLPALAIFDIMVSWLVGLLIYSTKKFRA